MASPPQTDSDTEDEHLHSNTDSAHISFYEANIIASLNSEVTGYPTRYGRRYHAYHEGKYHLPNDDREQERMHYSHSIYRDLLEGKLFLSPICSSPQRVLDLGTGTGFWAIDFADEHPFAEVIGTDLSTIQSPWVPPNCQFIIDDFEDEWVFSQPFDFVHGRELMGSVTNYDKLFGEAFKHLKLISKDDNPEKTKHAFEWVTFLHEGYQKLGKSLNGVETWKDKMKGAGFVDVECKILELPVGGWPEDERLKRIGFFNLEQAKHAVDSYSPEPFIRGLGWKQEEITVFQALVKKELDNPDIRLYQDVYVVYGRKP